MGSKITADGDCSFCLGRKAMTNLESVLKSRDITFPTKFPVVKAVVFPVFRYECESRAIKKAEYWRTDAFELWCWRRLLRVTRTARKSHQDILRKAKFQWFYDSSNTTPKLKEPQVGVGGLQYIGKDSFLVMCDCRRQTEIWVLVLILPLSTCITLASLPLLK